MPEKKHSISVIITVANDESRIEETLTSLIRQTIGFENIQVVLVNGGITDGSCEICERYQENYPDNFVYLDAGKPVMKYVSGTYVNFITPGDSWDSSALGLILQFFRNNPDVKIATGRDLSVSEGAKRNSSGNKYSETRVVDIVKEYNCPETSVSKTLIAAETAADQAFDGNNDDAEALLFLNKLILNEGKYGIIIDAEHIGKEKSSEAESAEDICRRHTDIYAHVYKVLIGHCKEKHGKVLPYLQYLMLTEMLPQLKTPVPADVEKKTAQAYLDTMKAVLGEISDEIIIKYRAIPVGLKTYILQLKNQRNVLLENGKLSKMLLGRTRLSMDILRADNEIEIHGVAAEKYISEDASVIAKDSSGAEYSAEYRHWPTLNVTGADQSIVMKGYSRSIRLPLKDKAVYSFAVRDSFGNERELKINTGKFSRLSSMEGSFICAGKYIIKLIENRLCVFDYHLKDYLVSSSKYDKTLKESADPETISLRKKGLRERRRLKKPIWIVSDRTDLAGDNGEALFSYLMNSEYKNKYDIYFVIDKESEDYGRLKKIGRVLAFGEEEHLIKQIAASAVISSAGEDWVFNPFGRNLKYFKDILNYKYIFLQHGIIKDDLSDWLHFLKKNIDMFVTSANAEYESIVSGNYGYGKDVVKLTGLARYDKLTNEPQKLIAIVPTWRKDIAADRIPGTSARVYSETFKDSEFFQFYNGLLNDEKLNMVLERTGYKGVLYLHPAFREQVSDFKDNKRMSVWRDRTDYSRVFRESSLLVTDYSSVAMDFAYMKKPVIYTQFDKERFFGSHTYKEGYFDYEKDGFGPVVYDYDSTLNAIISAVENDCKESEEYLDRINRFYAFTDRNNCKRIAQEIEGICK